MEGEATQGEGVVVACNKPEVEEVHIVVARVAMVQLVEIRMIRALCKSFSYLTKAVSIRYRLRYFTIRRQDLLKDKSSKGLCLAA